jgi:hypothetical protein
LSRASNDNEKSFSKRSGGGKEGKTMSFRFWLEEITRIHLEDAVREAGLGPLDMQYLVPVRTDEKQGKEFGVKSTQLDGEECAPSGYLVEPAFLR